MDNNTDKIKIEPITWWGIDSKSEVKQYDSSLKKKNIRYWIKQIDVGDRNTTMYGNTYNIYQYSIYNSKLINKEIILNSWKIRRIYDPIGKNAYNYTKAEYVDPSGEIRTKEVSTIQEAMKSLIEVCEYENWQTFDLNILNKKLKEENERLKSENELFQSKLNAFFSTRLYKRMLIKVQYNRSKRNSGIRQKSFIREYGVNSNFIHQWFEN